MKNSTLISSISAFICICAALSIIFVEKEPLSPDWGSILVSISAFLVAVVTIVWAYNFFTYEKRVDEKVKNAIADLYKEFDKKIEDIQYGIDAYYTYLGKAKIIGDYHDTMVACLEAIIIDSKSTNKLVTSKLSEELDTFVEKCNWYDWYFTNEEKAKYVPVVANLELKNKDKLINLIITSPEKEPEYDIIEEIKKEVF